MPRSSLPRHYVYRMDHDTGFAPMVHRHWCTLTGCKRSTVERWAGSGSWIVGIGGRGTSKPDRMIYAMRVEESVSLGDLRQWKPALAEYLDGRDIRFSDPVLVARRFYYFGRNARRLPTSLSHICIDRQGAWRLTDDDIEKLEAFLKRYRTGAHGLPNNSDACTPVVRLRLAC